MVEIDLLARLPELPVATRERRRGEGIVRVDGEVVGQIGLSTSWSRYALRSRVSATASSFHRLDVEWPLPPAVEEEILDRLADFWELGLEAELHPLFGEIWSLQVRSLGPLS